jgi:sodium/potassium-transporting ATPase subunit alpha
MFSSVHQLAVVFFCIGYWGNKLPFTAAFVNGFIVVAVACVPEGLPMTVVSCLSIASKNMAEKDCFVKQLQSVETMGSVSLICSDKTGTLTQNKMVVENFFFDLYCHAGNQIRSKCVSNMFRLEINEFFMKVVDLFHLLCFSLPVASMRREPVMPTFAYIEAIMGVCNRTRFEDHRELTPEQVVELEMLNTLDPQRTLSTLRAKLSLRLMDDTKRSIVGGDASEQAMFQFVTSRQSIELLRFHHNIEFEVPFNSKNKFSVTVATFRDPCLNNQKRRILMMKGAPERVLARCNTVMNHGRAVPIDSMFQNKFDDAYERFGNEGERVIGFACMELDAEADLHFSNDNWPQNGYTFLGLITLKDPPKDSVPPAIAKIRKAGIRVFMVTGDHHLV